MKISILFKPSEGSGITDILMNNGFLIISHKDMNTRNLLNLDRLIIKDIPEDNLQRIMVEKNNLFHKDAKILLCSSITNLEL